MHKPRHRDLLFVQGPQQPLGHAADFCVRAAAAIAAARQIVDGDSHFPAGADGCRREKKQS
jgi:hypothetical protein